jgi:ABC-2 type transport system ATP-binding protein
MSVIRTEGLCKLFDDFAAVDEVTFETDEGQSFGLLGPNGAGKSTLIRMLTTLIEPTSGTALVAGHDIRRNPDSVRREIGVIPQAMTSDPELTAAENLNFYARLYGLSGSARRHTVEELLVTIDLHEWRNHLVGTFSGGMRRRLEIGRSLLHKPKILFLDEPTTGLDPAYRLAMWQMIRELKSKSGLTLFLTTHYMEEADHLCDCVAIFDHGKIITMDTPSRLKGGLRESQLIEVRFGVVPEDWEVTIAGLPGVDSVDTSSDFWCINCRNSTDTVEALLAEARKAGVTVASLTVRGTTLEDVFVKYTGRGLRDALKSSSTREIGHLYEKRTGD